MLCGERRSGRNRKPLSILSPKGNLSSQIHLRGAQGEMDKEEPSAGRQKGREVQAREDSRSGRKDPPPHPPGRAMALLPHWA